MKLSSRDLSASLVVFLVALPLCLGIALASGAPLVAGIVAGIIGGIVVGSLSGSRIGVSGPAAGLAVIVAEAIERFGGLSGGGYPIFLAAVVIAGGLQLVLGLVRAGVIAYYFPNAVIRGMLAGIGILIFIKQIPHALGDDREPEGVLAFDQYDGETTNSEISWALDYINPGAVTITIIGLLLMILWQQSFVRENRILRQIPGALLAVVSGVVLYFVFLGTGWEISEGHTVSVPILSSLSDVKGLLVFPEWSAFLRSDVWLVGGTLAVIASIETLLSLEAIDRLDPHRDNTDTNRELFAQGAGNLMSGLVGGLPITQVIVRSSANLQAQAETKASAVIHGVWLLLAILLLARYLNYVPMASLAAVLMVIGYKLASPGQFKAQWDKGWSQFLPFVVTVLAIYFTDLLMGIGIGLGVSVIFLLARNYRMPYLVDTESDDDSTDLRLELSEHVSFLNKAAIRNTLFEVPRGSRVIVDATRSVDIDQDVLDVLEDFRVRAIEYEIDYTFLPSSFQLARNVNPVHTKPALHDH